MINRENKILDNSIINQISIKRMEFIKRNLNCVCVYLGKDSYKKLKEEESSPKYCIITKEVCMFYRTVVYKKCKNCHIYKLNNMSLSLVETVFGLEIIRVKGKKYKDYISVGIKE
jgi:hypothetical protein